MSVYRFSPLSYTGLLIRSVSALTLAYSALAPTPVKAIGQPNGSPLAPPNVSPSTTDTLVVAKAGELVNTAWQLTAWDDRQLFGSTPPDFRLGVTLNFTESALNGFAGCNTYQASYRLKKKDLILSPIASTRKACRDTVMQQELNYLTALQGATQYQIRRGQLEVSYKTSQSSGRLIFAAATVTNPTEKIIYVGSSRIPCTGVGQQQCLQVRQDPSQPWQAFPGTIQRFTYEPGYAYKLRVTERSIPNPPANGAAVAWTLIEIQRKVPESGLPNPVPSDRMGVLTADRSGSRIRVRTSPSTSAPSNTYGVVGDRVEILEETRASDGYTWYRVRFPTSKAEGWVRGDLVKVVNTPGSPTPDNGQRRVFCDLLAADSTLRVERRLCPMTPLSNGGFEFEVTTTQGTWMVRPTVGWKVLSPASSGVFHSTPWVVQKVTQSGTDTTLIELSNSSSRQTVVLSVRL